MTVSFPSNARTWPARTGRVLFLQHQGSCPPGHVGERVLQRGAHIEVARADQPGLGDPRRYDLVVSLGSYDSAYDDSLPYVRRELRFLRAAVESDVPVFGICFGAQLLSRALGGQVFRAQGGPEIGWLTLDTADTGDSVGVEPGPWLVWHQDVMTTPPGGVELARTAVGTQVFAHGRHLGVQFHPEAMTEGVLTWARHYRDVLPEVGVDRDKLVLRTRELATQTRQRAYRLTDRVVDGLEPARMAS